MRRMDDKIKRLCAQAITAKDEEIKAILIELQNALHEHIEGVRARVADYPFIVERRSDDPPLDEEA